MTPSPIAPMPPPRAAPVDPMPVSLPPPVIPPGSLPDIVLQRGPWWMVPGIATLVIAVFAGALLASCFMDNDTLRTQMFAIAGAGFTTVLGYLFGSSAGSQKKDDMAAAKAATPQPQPPPTA